MYNMNMWENVQLLTDPKMIIHKTAILLQHSLQFYILLHRTAPNNSKVSSSTKYHSEVSPRPSTRTSRRPSGRSCPCTRPRPCPPGRQGRRRAACWRRAARSCPRPARTAGCPR